MDTKENRIPLEKFRDQKALQALMVKYHDVTFVAYEWQGQQWVDAYYICPDIHEEVHISYCLWGEGDHYRDLEIECGYRDYRVVSPRFDEVSVGKYHDEAMDVILDGFDI